MKTFSVSQLNTFLQCPRAWWLIYEIKIKTPKSANLFYGSAVHSAIASFFRRKDPVVAIEEYLRIDPFNERQPSFDVEAHVKEGKTTMELYKTKAPYFEPEMIEERKVVDLMNPLTHEALSVPFTFKFDAIADDHIIDFKTTKGNGLKYNIIQLSIDEFEQNRRQCLTN